MVPWLVLSCYLLGAVALTWQLWADPASRAQVGDPEDVDLLAWFMRYGATAVAHGHLPALVTSAMNAPRGINLMWNTSFLLPGILMAPVTLLAGPQVSLTIVLTLGFAGSAASLFWVLRRWEASIIAAALGGAVYGFSPALLQSGIGHYQIQLAVLPPLIIDAVLRIVTGRGNAVRTGVWLGLLTAAQLFTGEEVLVLTAVAGLLFVAVLAAAHRRAARDRARGTAVGLMTGAAVGIVICGPALWVQLHGPLTEHGSWEGLDTFTSHLSTFVTPPGTVLFHTRASAAAASSGLNFTGEYLAYLGWPLIVVLVAAAIRYWRHPKVRAAAVTCAVLELLSLGGQSRTLLGFRYPGELLPWHWLQGMPAIGNVLPDRIAVVADGAAAVVLAFSLDLARSAVPEPARRRRRSLPTAVAALALLPLIPVPIHAAATAPVPAGWEQAFSRLRLAPGARVLVVPVPYSGQPQVMRWQAETGEPQSFIGGWFVGPNLSGHASVGFFGRPSLTGLVLYLDDVWAGSAHAIAPSQDQIRDDLGYLRPAAVVAVASRDSHIGRVLTGLFGPPAYREGQVLAWRLAEAMASTRRTAPRTATASLAAVPGLLTGRTFIAQPGLTGRTIMARAQSARSPAQ
jgi:dolichyl-phosphate beta-glucosyltransferase